MNLARACGNDQQQACSTSQSTTISTSGGWASLANDGNGNRFTQTSGAAGVCGGGFDTMTPWWMVDFGYTRSIGGGKIWGRTASGTCSAECLARLTGFQIWVGSSSTVYNASGNMNCFTSTTTEETQAPYTHAFDCAAKGQYLFVVLTTGKCLSMREIEVYSIGEEQDVVSVPKYDARGWLDTIRAGLKQKLDKAKTRSAHPADCWGRPSRDHPCHEGVGPPITRRVLSLLANVVGGE
jgi:hypothetical protein